MEGVAIKELTPTIITRSGIALAHWLLAGLGGGVTKHFSSSSENLPEGAGSRAYDHRPHQLIWDLRRRLTRRTAPTADIRLRVSNPRRQTVLGVCVEVADTAQKRRRGLLGRQSLSPGEGLWISPCEAVHTFAMQFPIDLVYLDREHRILKLRGNVQPWRLSGCLWAHSVLELASGTLRESQSRPGDRLEFSPVIRTGKSTAISAPGLLQATD